MKTDGVKSMRKVLRVSIGLLVNVCIILLFVLVFSNAYEFAHDVFAPVCKDDSDESVVAVTILDDSSVWDVGDALDEAGVVKNKYALCIKIYITKKAPKIRPGTYELSPSYTNDEIITVITGGKLEEDG